MSTLSGITKNGIGQVLGGCEVFLFKYDSTAHTLTQIGAFTTSDALTGAYSFTGIVDTLATYLVVMFKNGSPNVFDVTDHVLQPV